MAQGPPKQRPATLRDIARQAGVSHTTVALALDPERSSRVSQATRKRVAEIARRLDYRPNHIARSLATRQTKTIGLVVTTLLNPFYAEIAQDIMERAQELGYGVALSSGASLQEERRAVEGFLNRGVDGLIVCSAQLADPVVDDLLEQGRPFVLAMRNVDRSPGGRAVNHVGLDNQGGAFMAMEHLLSLGHHRIGLIAGPREVSTGRDRQLGAMAALEKWGLKLDPELMAEGDFSRASGQELAVRLLDLPARPTAIFAMNDEMALGVLEAVQERGMSVPQDLALVGFDDIFMAGLKGIDLTTISQKKAVMGKMAVDRLIGLLQGHEAGTAQTVFMEPILVKRKSCGHHLPRAASSAL